MAEKKSASTLHAPHEPLMKIKLWQ